MTAIFFRRNLIWAKFEGFEFRLKLNLTKVRVDPAASGRKGHQQLEGGLEQVVSTRHRTYLG